MKKIVIALASVLLLTGCVKQSTTVVFNNDNTAIMEKKLNTGDASLMGASGTMKMIEKKFIDSVKKQNPTSVLRFNNGTDSGIVANIKFNDITKEDVFAKETFFIPKYKKNVDCKKQFNKTKCVADFNVNISGEQIELILEENQMTYKDLKPFELIIQLPVQAQKHNASFFDLEKNLYIWEIEAGVYTPVNFIYEINN